MAFVTIETPEGKRQVRVCDYCKAVCIPSGQYCSGHCARNAEAASRLAIATENDGDYSGDAD